MQVISPAGHTLKHESTSKACTSMPGVCPTGHKYKHAEGVSAAAACQLVAADNKVVAEGWAAVGGHAAVIQQLKEMVLLPLQYPHIFKHMDITPPRGILFHGSPGFTTRHPILMHKLLSGIVNPVVMHAFCIDAAHTAHPVHAADRIDAAHACLKQFMP